MEGRVALPLKSRLRSLPTLNPHLPKGGPSRPISCNVRPDLLKATRWRAMPTHKFKIGQTVFIKPFFHRNVPGGAYIVVQKMPEHDGEFQYRVRSTSERHERVVSEN